MEGSQTRPREWSPEHDLDLLAGLGAERGLRKVRDADDEAAGRAPSVLRRECKASDLTIPDYLMVLSEGSTKRQALAMHARDVRSEYLALVARQASMDDCTPIVVGLSTGYTTRKEPWAVFAFLGGMLATPWLQSNVTHLVARTIYECTTQIDLKFCCEAPVDGGAYTPC
jgi:hypothetical protein